MAIKTKITVDNSQLKKGMKDAQATTQKTMKKIQDTAKGIQGGFQGILSVIGKLGPVGKGVAISIGFIGAAVAGVVKLMNNLAGKMDNIGKSAKSVDLTTTAYQELNYAAGNSGISMQKVINILSTLKQKFTSASQGVKDTVDSFAALGLSWSELQKKTPEQQLLSILRAAEAIADLNMRNRLLLKIFKKSDVAQIKKMIDVDFGRQMASAKIMGVVIDEDAIRMAESYNDSLSLANKRIIAMASNLKATKDAMKTISEFTQKMTENLSFSDKISDNYKNEYYAIGDVVEQINKRLPKHMVNNLNKEIQRKANIQMLNRAQAGQLLTPEQIKQIREQAKMRVYNGLIRLHDARFNINDKKTWVQKRPTPIEDDPARNKEKIVQDKVNAALTRRNKELQQVRSKYLNIVRDLQNELDLEKQIARIEKETGGKVKNGQRQDFINRLMEARLARNEAILATINKETDALNSQFQIQKAILQGDVKRAETLKMIAKLKQQGINVSEGDFNNVDQSLSNVNSEIARKKQELKKYQGDNRRYTAAADYKRKLEQNLKVNAEQLKENEKQYKEQTSLKSSFKRFMNGENNEYYDPKRTYEQTKRSIEREQQAYTKLLASAKKGMEDNQKGSKQYLRIQQQIKKLQSQKTQLDVIKTSKQQLELAQKNKTVLDNMTIDKIITDSKQSVALQIAQLNNNQKMIIQLQTINQLKQKGIISDEKDLQRVKEKYQELLKQKQLNKEQVDNARVDKTTDDLKFQNDILNAQIQGDLQRVNALKTILQLKQMGIKADLKSLETNKKYNQLYQQQEKSRELNLKQSLQDQGYSLLYQAMRSAGLSKQASKLQAVRNAEKQKGSSLSGEEYKLVTGLVDLQFKLNKAINDNKVDISKYEIKTNQLTARGGFAGGAVSVHKDTVNEAIRNNGQQILTVIKQIKSIMQNGGLI